MKNKVILFLCLFVCLITPIYAESSGFAQMEKEIVLESDKETFILENKVDQFFKKLGVDLMDVNNKTQIVLFNYSDKALINLCIAFTISGLILMMLWLGIHMIIAFFKMIWNKFRWMHHQRIMTKIRDVLLDECNPKE